METPLVEKNAENALSQLGSLIGHDAAGRQAIDALKRLLSSHHEMRRVIEQHVARIQRIQSIQNSD